MAGLFALLSLAVIGTMVFNFTKAGSGGPSIVGDITTFGTNLYGDLVGK